MKTDLVMRILLLALALLMTLLSFTACNTPSSDGPETGDPTQPSGGGETPTTPPEGGGETPTTPPEGNGDEESPNLPTEGFGGDEFKVYARGWGDEGFDYASELFVGYTLNETPTSLDRAVYERMVLVQDTYGVLFDVQTRDGNLDKVLVDSSVKTGSDVFDLFVDHGVQIFAHAQNNLLLDYAQLPYVNTENAWWNQDANKNFRTAGGKLFAMTGDISFFSVGSAFAMFFNKDLISSVQGLESPYEKVYADEWDFETFENYVTTTASNMDRDGSGTVETDSFGYGTAEWRGPVQAFYSTGERSLIRKNDEWRFSVSKDICTRQFADLRELLHNSGVAYLFYGVDYSALRTAFTSNRVVFFDDNLQAASLFKGTDVNFGLLPWPKYDLEEVDEYYSAVDAGTNVYSVPRNTTQENAVKISVVLEALAYYGHRDVMPFYYDTILSYQYLKDEDAIKMLDIIHDSLVFDLGYFLGNPMSSVYRSGIISTEGSVSLSKLTDETLGSAEDHLKDWDALDKEN